uniref:Secreted protein n=1 Tax=Steinernema glaseri TaxID=37863 RepID=A0A1I8AF60_9BILA
MRLFLLLALGVWIYCEGASIPMDIDLSNIREGTVTKPDGTKVTTTVKKEGETTVVSISETGTDGSQHTKTIRRRLGSSSGDSGIEIANPIQRVHITSDHNPTQEELTELNDEHQPGKWSEAMTLPSVFRLQK